MSRIKRAWAWLLDLPGEDSLLVVLFGTSCIILGAAVASDIRPSASTDAATEHAADAQLRADVRAIREMLEQR